MKLAYALLLSSITMVSCRDRGAASKILDSRATAAPSEQILTQSGDRVYPSAKMLQAALNSLNAAQAARESGNVALFKKQLSKARLHLRMRPAANRPQGGESTTSTIVCTLERVGHPEQKILAKLPARAGENEVASSTDGGLDVGSNNYSFDMYLSEGENNASDLNVVFYENNNVQDEVGAMACGVESGAFCKEPLTDENDRKVANFSCTLN